MKKTLSRRDALLGTLFGTGMIGLRSLATGLPVKLLLDPRKALADTPGCSGTMGTPQFVIFNTSGGGDPIGCNAPGTYDDKNNPGMDFSKVMHPNLDGSMNPTELAIGKSTYTAAAPWAKLGPGTGNADVLGRSCFCHIMTNTPVHPKEPDVLKLMGATAAAEMFPSILGKALQPCLQTLQAQPIVLSGMATATFGGQPLAPIPPQALKTILTKPPTALGTTLQLVRDDTLKSLYDVYKNGASPAQQAYIDSMVISQGEARNIRQDLVAKILDIKDGTADSQIVAAITLIQMGVSPVMVINIPFGQDNHTDPGFKLEMGETQTGMATLVNTLLGGLRAANLSDSVSLVSLNVFGRTMLNPNLNPGNTNGRGHNDMHQMSLMIGKPFKGSVIGGITSKKDNTNGAGGVTEIAAMPIDSTSGYGSTAGDIQPLDSLASFAKTVMAGFGIDQTTIDSSIIGGGKVIGPALTQG